jgi:hypothetical protein
LLGGAVKTAILVAASSLAFGSSIWPTWGCSVMPTGLQRPEPRPPSCHGKFDHARRRSGGRADCSELHCRLVTMMVWVCFGRGVTLFATAARLVGTFLAIAYAFVYNMPMLTNAVLMFIRQKIKPIIL